MNKSIFWVFAFVVCSVFVSANFQLPCSNVLDPLTKNPMCNNIGVINLVTNNSLFLNGLPSSSFALMSNLSAYYLNSNPRGYINISGAQVFNETATIQNVNTTLNNRINAINSSSSSFSGMINTTQVNSTNTPTTAQTLIYNGTLDKFTWVTPSGATYTAQAPFLFLSGTTFNFNTTKANIDYNDTLYCDAGLGQKTKIFNASCNGNEVLREVYGGNVSSYYYCVNVTASGSSNFTAYNSTTSWSSNALNVSGSSFTNVNGISQLIITATGGGGNPFNQNLNTTDDALFNNVNATGDIYLNNNRCLYIKNSTGSYYCALTINTLNQLVETSGTGSTFTLG